MRVVTVQFNGQIIKVCENKTAFEQWLDNSDYDREQLKVLYTRVREEQ